MNGGDSNGEGSFSRGTKLQFQIWHHKRIERTWHVFVFTTLGVILVNVRDSIRNIDSNKLSIDLDRKTHTFQTSIGIFTCLIFQLGN